MITFTTMPNELTDLQKEHRQQNMYFQSINPQKLSKFSILAQKEYKDMDFLPNILKEEYQREIENKSIEHSPNDEAAFGTLGT